VLPQLPLKFDHFLAKVAVLFEQFTALDYSVARRQLDFAERCPKFHKSPFYVVAMPHNRQRGETRTGPRGTILAPAAPCGYMRMAGPALPADLSISPKHGPLPRCATVAGAFSLRLDTVA
jgi:hypothetical protein